MATRTVTQTFDASLNTWQGFAGSWFWQAADGNPSPGCFEEDYLGLTNGWATAGPVGSGTSLNTVFSLVSTDVPNSITGSCQWRIVDMDGGPADFTLRLQVVVGGSGHTIVASGASGVSGPTSWAEADWGTIDISGAAYNASLASPRVDLLSSVNLGKNYFRLDTISLTLDYTPSGPTPVEIAARSAGLSFARAAVSLSSIVTPVGSAHGVPHTGFLQVLAQAFGGGQDWRQALEATNAYSPMVVLTQYPIPAGYSELLVPQRAIALVIDNITGGTLFLVGSDTDTGRGLSTTNGPVVLPVVGGSSVGLVATGSAKADICFF